MNRRTMKKILSDQLRYSTQQVRRAAHKAGLWWFAGSQTEFWCEIGDLPQGPQWRRRSRRVRNAHAGWHDWAFTINDIPF